ncbi:HAT family dimerization domain containing protein [Trifolium medium]|uniref:HAT family dimerization domain containing protein n=1 Tax=Trifolium medium TaxID=97028 RepID=A0A392M4M2_9FABA|nr:HAT family dimerization domain containing protein [Trifolium medium]
MSDGWTDKKRRSICNFLVNSPNGTIFLYSFDTSDISKTTDKVFKMLDDVVNLVGEENVVQVVTDNAANYKAAGENVDAYTEEFVLDSMKKHTKGKDLIRPGITRFATAYLTLSCLNDNKGALMSLFTSEDWKGNPNEENIVQTEVNVEQADVTVNNVEEDDVIVSNVVQSDGGGNVELSGSSSNPTLVNDEGVLSGAEFDDDDGEDTGEDDGDDYIGGDDFTGALDV